jgi:hypothetical protein
MRRRFVRQARIARSGAWQAAGGMRLRPARHFRDERAALEYARNAANTFRVAYAVWRVRKGTLKLPKRYPPAHGRVGARQRRETEERFFGRYPHLGVIMHNVSNIIAITGGLAALRSRPIRLHVPSFMRLAIEHVGAKPCSSPKAARSPLPAFVAGGAPSLASQRRPGRLRCPRTSLG